MSESALESTAAPAPLPLDGWHRARGARMVPFAGHWLPLQYEGIMAEHLWTREAASLFDVSHMGQLRVSGHDAATALERLLPGDMHGLGVGQMRYSMLLNDAGGILDDLMVTRRDDCFHLVVNGAMKVADTALLAATLPAGIHLATETDRALLALQGPKAAAALEQLLPGVSRLAFMTAAAFRWQDAAAFVSRSGYSGEDGFEISLAAASAMAFAEALSAFAEVKPAGLGARDSLRLEAGLSLYGHDLDAETTPVMAGLGFAIPKRRREEGGFPGHARLVAEWRDGASRKRIGLLVEGRQPVREGATILDQADREIGHVTSGGFAPTLGRPIAMGYVPPALATPTTALTLLQRGRRFATTITPMPFVPHRYARQKG